MNGQNNNKGWGKKEGMKTLKDRVITEEITEWKRNISKQFAIHEHETLRKD